MSKRLFLYVLALFFLTTPAETKAQSFLDSLAAITLTPLRKIYAKYGPKPRHTKKPVAQPETTPPQPPKPTPVRRIPLEKSRAYKAKTSKITRDSITVTRKKDSKKITLQLVINPIEEYTKALKAFMHLKEKRPSQTVLIADFSGDSLRIYEISSYDVLTDIYLKDVTDAFDTTNPTSQTIEDKPAIHPISRPVIKLKDTATDEALLECYAKGIFGTNQLFLRNHKFLCIENFTIAQDGKDVPFVLIKDVTSQIVSDTPALLSFE